MMISIETQRKFLVVIHAKNCSLLSRNFREKSQQCEILCSLTYFLYKDPELPESCDSPHREPSCHQQSTSHYV